MRRKISVISADGLTRWTAWTLRGKVFWVKSNMRPAYLGEAWRIWRHPKFLRSTIDTSPAFCVKQNQLFQCTYNDIFVRFSEDKSIELPHILVPNDESL